MRFRAFGSAANSFNAMRVSRRSAARCAPDRVRGAKLLPGLLRIQLTLEWWSEAFGVGPPKPKPPASPHNVVCCPHNASPFGHTASPKIHPVLSQPQPEVCYSILCSSLQYSTVIFGKGFRIFYLIMIQYRRAEYIIVRC